MRRIIVHTRPSWARVGSGNYTLPLVDIDPSTSSETPPLQLCTHPMPANASGYEYKTGQIKWQHDRQTGQR